MAETQIELESEQFVSEKKTPKSLFVKHKTQFCTILGFLHNLMNSNIISNEQLDSFIATLPLGKSVSEQISYLDSFDLKDIEINLFRPLHKQFKSRKPTVSPDAPSLSDMPEKKKRNSKKSGKPTVSPDAPSLSDMPEKKKRNSKKKTNSTSSDTDNSNSDSNSDKEIVQEEKESEPVIVSEPEPVIVAEEIVEKKTKKTTKKTSKKTDSVEETQILKNYKLTVFENDKIAPLTEFSGNDIESLEHTISNYYEVDLRSCDDEQLILHNVDPEKMKKFENKKIIINPPQYGVNSWGKVEILFEQITEPKQNKKNTKK